MAALFRRDYARLWTASAISSLGDGITLAAGPLLMASLTDDPAMVAGAVFVQQLPWLLFSLFAGVLVDRVDRRFLLATVDAIRGIVMLLLMISVWQSWVSVPVVYTLVFLLGIGSTLTNNAAQALTPSVVEPSQLARANAWLSGARMVGDQFIGPPLGGLLFALFVMLPFGLDALTFLISAGLVATIRGAVAFKGDTAVPKDSSRPTVRHQITDGLRWLWRHRALRVLAVSMGIMNITYGSAFGAFVLYARQQLGMSASGYGVLLATIAVGGVLGTLTVTRLELKFGAAALLRIGLIVETSTYLVLALATTPLVAGAILVLFGAHAAIWGVVSVTLRQRIIPTELIGRINSVYLLFSMGGFSIGALIGGAVGHAFGVSAPFWEAFALMVVTTVAAWRFLTPNALSPTPDPVSQ